MTRHGLAVEWREELHSGWCHLSFGQMNKHLGSTVADLFDFLIQTSLNEAKEMMSY